MKGIALLAALAIIGGWAIVAWRLRENTLTAYKLCVVLAVRIDAADKTLGKPASSSYDYFQEHPKALAAAHREDREILESLPCPLPAR